MNKTILFSITLLLPYFIQAYSIKDTSHIDFGLTRLQYSDTQYLEFPSYGLKLINNYHKKLNINYTINRIGTFPGGRSNVIKVQIIHKPIIIHNSRFDTIKLNFSENGNYLTHTIIISRLVINPDNQKPIINLYSGKVPISVILDSTEFQNDTLKEGQILRFAFKIRNTDTIPVRIHVDDNCKLCLNFNLNNSILFPGQTQEFEFIFNTVGKNGNFNRIEMVEINNQKYSLKFRSYIQPK